MSRLGFQYILKSNVNLFFCIRTEIFRYFFSLISSSLPLLRTKFSFYLGRDATKRLTWEFSKSSYEIPENWLIVDYTYSFIFWGMRNDETRLAMPSFNVLCATDINHTSYHWPRLFLWPKRPILARRAQNFRSTCIGSKKCTTNRKKHRVPITSHKLSARKTQPRSTIFTIKS